MIEGVNVSIASSSLVRAVSEQATAARSYAENPEQVQQVPQAPYVSPYVSIDYTKNVAVLQIRDSDTGEVVRQIPSDNQLKAYRRAAEAEAAERPVAKAPTPDTVDGGDTAAVEAGPAPAAAPTQSTTTSDDGAGDAAQTAASVLISA